MPTPWPQPCPVTTNVAVPVVAAFCARAGAAGPVPSRMTETIASVRRIELTPARTRTRLAKRLMCSGFLYGTLISSFGRACTGQTRDTSVGVRADILPARYRDPEQIGRGGMGDIYRATDAVLGRDVAVKILAERYAQDASVRERFTREALAAARLSAPRAISRGSRRGESARRRRATGTRWRWSPSSSSPASVPTRPAARRKRPPRT